MFRRIGLPAMLLAAATLFWPPKPADAKAHFGFYVGPSYPLYPYSYPYVYPNYYYYGSPYYYSSPWYGTFGGWGWNGHHGGRGWGGHGHHHGR